MKNFLIYLKRTFLLEIKKTIAYPASFWIDVLTIPLFISVQIMFIESIFTQTNDFLGYTKYQAYVLFGTYNFIHASGHVFFYNRLAELKGMIRGDAQESFDSALIKPMDSQLFATLGRFSFGDLGQYTLNLALIFYGIFHQGNVLNIVNIITYILLIGMGILTFYLTYLFISTLLFYYPQLQVTEDLWEEFSKLGQYPSGLYKGYMGALVNLVVPLTLLGSIPVEALFGKTPQYMLGTYAAVLFILFLLTRIFWKYSVNKYSSFSS